MQTHHELSLITDAIFYVLAHILISQPKRLLGTLKIETSIIGLDKHNF